MSDSGFLPGFGTNENAKPGDVWRAIEGWPGYEVSIRGAVRSYWGAGGKTQGRRGIGRGPKQIGGHVLRSGHRSVVLFRNGSRERRTVGIHVLVLEVFVGPRPEGMQACHNDGDPANNCVENLRWDTPQENTRDTLRHGTHVGAKLTEEQIPAIWERLVAGESAVSIARSCGVVGATITNIRRGSQWSHITRHLPGWPLVDEPAAELPIYIADEFAKTDEEIWRVVSEWEAYQVSNFGNVRTCWQVVKGGRRGQMAMSDEWRPRVASRNKDGHLILSASRGPGTARTLYVHQLVLTAFACPRPKGAFACHNDGNPANNHASNLRWDTATANRHDAFKHERERQGA
jgi:hypothetical protein